MSHTYAHLEVSAETYDEIAAKLRAVDYVHAFHEQDDGEPVIDMHGIALQKGPLRERQRFTSGRES